MADLEMRDNPHREMDGIPDRPFDMQRQLYNISQPGMIEVIERMRAAFDEAGGIFTVAEIGGEDPHTTMTAYTSGDNRLDTAYSFDFIGTREVSPDHIRAILSKWPNALDQGYPSWAFSNHDTARVASRWDLGIPQDQAAKLFALMQVALRGVLFIYQGEELGLPKQMFRSRNCKTQKPSPIGRKRRAATAPARRCHGPRMIPMRGSAALSLGYRLTLAIMASPYRSKRMMMVPSSTSSATPSHCAKAQPPCSAENLSFSTRRNRSCFGSASIKAKAILCAFNLGGEAYDINLPDGRWALELAANMAADASGEAPTHLPPHSGYLARRA